MKPFLILLTLCSLTAKAQFHSRLTNNNRLYNDSTAKLAIDSLYSLILAGKDFKKIAFDNSQDPGSYLKGGELKPSTMEEYINDYRAVVLTLQLNEISRPFKSDYGYHIVQLIAKKDSLYTTRHILIRTD